MTSRSPNSAVRPRAQPVDPQPMHALVSVLNEQALEAGYQNEGRVMDLLRAAQAAHKALCEQEARNAGLAATDGNWTRLATMAPLHPDDQRVAEARMRESRLVVLEQGRRAALRDLGLDPDAPEHAHAASGEIGGG